MGFAAAPAAGRQFDPALAMRTFDVAWQLVYDTHFDTTFNGVDWLAVRDELRPRAEAATSNRELRAVIGEMIGRLGQSHFALIPREVSERGDALDDAEDAVGGDAAGVGDAGLDVRLLDGRVVVASVEEAGPAWAAGIRPGWIVLSTNDRAIDSLVTRLNAMDQHMSLATRVWSVVLGRLGGPPGSTLALTMLDGADDTVRLALTRRREPSTPVKFGNLPPFFARYDGRAVPVADGHAVGVIWFNFWMVPLIRQVDSAVNAYRQFDGMVVDLRGNRGGLGAMVMGVAGHFFDERVLLGTFKTRTASLQIAANPRRVSPAGTRVQPFAGPVAVLVDETSASASEVFAGGMQVAGRVRVFGSTSAGAVLPATTDELPNGDVLYHAFAEFVTPNGVALEARGVIPDEVVRPDRETLLAGRDVVMEAALRWIAAQRAAIN